MERGGVRGFFRTLSAVQSPFKSLNHSQTPTYLYIAYLWLDAGERQTGPVGDPLEERHHGQRLHKTHRHQPRLRPARRRCAVLRRVLEARLPPTHSIDFHFILCNYGTFQV